MFSDVCALFIITIFFRGNWEGVSEGNLFWMNGRRLQGATVGIVGFGRIG